MKKSSIPQPQEKKNSTAVAPEIPAVNKNFPVDNYPFPADYNVSRLTLIARDPFWVHAYWEISQDALRDARAKLGPTFDSCGYVVRMHDVSQPDGNESNAQRSFDIDVGPQARDRDINVGNDNAGYCGEIGLKEPGGHFHSLAQSNVIATPRASFSDRRDEIWMERDESTDAQPFVWDPSQGSKIRRKTLSRKISYPVLPKEKRHRRYLSEHDIRAYYANLFPLLRKIRGRKRGRGQKPIVPSATRPQPLKKILGWDPGLAGDTSRHHTFTKEEYFKKFFLGSSAEFMLEGGASEQRLGASEREQPRQRKFFFEIWAELIVYGRTEPDATVYLGDKHIPLRGDGTFSLRYALPDGTIPFPFTAESADKIETRGIATSAIRTTTTCTNSIKAR